MSLICSMVEVEKAKGRRYTQPFGPQYDREGRALE